MKIIVLRNNLKESLDVLGRLGGEGAGTLPVLKNFLLRASSGKIFLSATNLELAITKTMPGKIIDSGGITVNLTLVSSLIGNLLAERIQLETEGAALVLKTDTYHAKLQGIKEEEFPIIPQLTKPEVSFRAPAGLLSDALLFIANAAHGNAGKPELNGALFDLEKGMLTMVATDNFRLAKKVIYESHLDLKNITPVKILVPARTILEALRVYKNSAASVHVAFDQNQILFSDDSSEIISRLTGGNFPDYEAIVPKEALSEATVDRQEFVAALKLTGSFADRLNEVNLVLKENAKTIEVSSAQSLGESRCLVPARVKGTATEIVFNWRFLLEGIKDIPTKTITLKLSGDARPAVVLGAEDPSYLYLLMPIKTA